MMLDAAGQALASDQHTVRYSDRREDRHMDRCEDRQVDRSVVRHEV